jgi:hypothetical protein
MFTYCNFKLYRKYFGSKLYLFPCKKFSFWGLLFSVCWFMKRHIFKAHALHFQLHYECDVIFIFPQICAYFVNTHIRWKYVNVYLTKTKVHRESWHSVCRTVSRVHRKKLVEFLKYNNIKIIKTFEKRCFAYTENISGLSSIYFHAKTILFGDYFFLRILVCERTRFIFSRQYRKQNAFYSICIVRIFLKGHVLVCFEAILSVQIIYKDY